jgi:hypothetical protein
VGAEGLLVPLGGAFFDKGADAFLGVAVHHVFDHDLPGIGVGVVDGHFGLRVEGGFADFDGRAQFGRDGLCEVTGFAGQLVGWRGAVDQASGFGLIGGHEPARGQQFKGFLAADIAAECDHGGGAEQADIYAVHAEPRIVGGNGQIAGRDQLATRGGGDAVDLGDDGLGQGPDGGHDPCAGVEQPMEIGFATVGGLSALGHFLEVVTGAECFAIGAQDHRADRGVGGQSGALAFKRGEHGFGQGIQCGGVVQRQGGDAVGVVAQQDIRDHSGSPVFADSVGLFRGRIKRHIAGRHPQCDPCDQARQRIAPHHQPDFGIGHDRLVGCPIRGQIQGGGKNQTANEAL